jgi:hypothetical protein
MSETAFKFLLQNGTQPFRPSTCFIVADPKVMDRKIWTLELDRPKDAEWVFQIDDMKDWMLHGTEPVRKMYYDRSNPLTSFRELDRDEVFREYLRKIFDKLPAEYRQRRKYALMPSIGDDKTRTRYKDAVEAALPDVTIIPDPAGQAADILVRSNLMTCYAAIYWTQVEPDTIVVCCAAPWFSFTYAAACEPEPKVYVTDQRGSDLCPRRRTGLRRR